LKLTDPEISEQLLENLSELQKKLRYGLPSNDAIQLYELGVSDRHISQEFSRKLTISNESLDTRIKKSGKALIESAKNFPSYYEDIISRLVSDI